MRASGLERLAFLLALAFFAFLYGWGAGSLGWFPGPIVDAAVRHAYQLLRPPYLAPRVYDRQGIRVVERSEVQPGATLLASMWPDGGDWTAGLRLVDADGRLLHEWRAPAAEIFSQTRPRGQRLGDTYIHGAYLFENGDVLVDLELVGTARLDACSRVVWTLDQYTHHSIARDDHGDFWIPALDYWDDAATIAEHGEYPGLQPPLINNRLLKVSAGGEVLEDIPMLDVVYENGLERYLAKAGQVSSDVLHVNDVEPLPDSLAPEYPSFEAGDLLVSIRNPSLVLVLDPETRNVKWYASDPFIRQHDPDFVGNGWIGVFDNNRDRTPRGTMLGGSRIVAVEPASDSLEILFPGPQSEPFYSDVMGKWQLLANRNLLLTEAEAGRAVEVAPDGHTVWEWIQEPYDDSRVPEVTEATRYPLSAEQIAAWPCGPGRGEDAAGAAQ